MDKLGITESQLQRSHTVFHGIMPGHSCSAIGKVRLDVLFGNPENFRREPIWFEVVNLQSPYHTLLGRPALAKFMAVPHYAYLKMKMPSLMGFITIADCYKWSLECARAGSMLAESLVIAEEKRQLLPDVATLSQSDVPTLGQPARETSFEPAKDTKEILLDPAHPNRFITVGAGLMDK
jgi:hypothetical protein